MADDEFNISASAANTASSSSSGAVFGLDSYRATCARSERRDRHWDQLEIVDVELHQVDGQLDTERRVFVVKLRCGGGVLFLELDVHVYVESVEYVTANVAFARTELQIVAEYAAAHHLQWFEFEVEYGMLSGVKKWLLFALLLLLLLLNVQNCWRSSPCRTRWASRISRPRRCLQSALHSSWVWFRHLDRVDVAALLLLLLLPLSLLRHRWLAVAAADWRIWWRTDWSSADAAERVWWT